MEKKWKHDELASDLAVHLNSGERNSRMVFENVPMGSGGSARPDVWKMEKSFANPAPVAYEIKVSVSDFRSDVTSGKWQKYLQYSGAVVFAVPAGLITKKDIPSTCGLIVRSEKGWRMAKKPVIEKVEIPQDVFIRLLIRAFGMAEEETRTIKIKNHFELEAARAKLGKDFSEFLQRRESAERKIINLEQHYEAKQKRLEEKYSNREQELLNHEHESKLLYRELCSILGIETTKNRWPIKSALQDLKESIELDSVRQTLALGMKNQKAQLERMLKSTEGYLKQIKMEGINEKDGFESN